MAIIYSDNEPKPQYPIKIDRVDANKAYNKHLVNWYYLKFIVTNSTDFSEKVQANRELAIAERKMAFWYRQPTFSIKRCAEETDRLKTDWRMSIEPDLKK